MDGGIGEAALLSAAIGGGASAIQGKDPFQGALMGGLLGGAGYGLLGELGGASGNVVDAGGDTLVSAGSAGQAPVYEATGNIPGTTAPVTGSTSVAGTPLQSANISQYSDYGQENPFISSAPTTNGIVGAQGPQNVLQNQLGATVGGAPVNPMYTDMPATGIGGAGYTDTISPAAGAVPTGAGATAAGGNTGISGLMGRAGDFISENALPIAGVGGVAYLMNQERNRYGVPATEKYTGPLSKFSYNPSTYQPDIVRPPSPLYRAQYAAGGPIEQMTNENAIGANTGFPQAYMHNNAYATPYQTPISENVLMGAGDTKVDPYTGEEQQSGGMNQPMGRVNFASGGISSLGAYSDGGRMLKGPGDGMSDDIPARIGGKQEARLADGEFVVPADVVSHLGNGSTDAGAKQLYSMMDKVRQARTGRKAQGRQIKPNKYMPA